MNNKNLVLFAPLLPDIDALASVLALAGYVPRLVNNLEDLNTSCHCDSCGQVVIADIDSVEADSLLQTVSQCPHRPQILLLASDPNFALRLSAVRAGVFRFIPKPVDTRRLLTVVAQLFENPINEPYRVLIVDDDPLTAEYHAALLLSQGIGATSVRTPNEALTVARQYMPELILLDYYLDGCTGAELVAILREDEVFSQIPVLFLSAGEQDDLERRVLHELGEEFIRKPVQPSTFAAMVAARAKYARAARRLIRELQHSERMSRDLQRSLDEHAIVSIADPAGNIIFANDKFCEISGYSRSELLGKSHSLIKSAVHSPDFYHEMWDTITRGGVWHGEVCNRRKNGELYWVSATITPFLDEYGIPYQYVSARTDITELKRTQARLTALVNSANVGLAWLNPQGRFTDCNETFPALLGYNRDEFLTMSNRKVTHPDDIELTRRYMSLILSGETEFVRVEKRYLHRDGHIIWGDLTLARVVNEMGELVGLTGTVLDITARRQAEEALRDAKDAAEQASRAKSEFLSRMSHELRTPMNAVLGFAQLLESDPENPPTERQQESIQQITRAGWHLLELINEVLDLAKIEAGKVQIQLTELQVEELIGDCLALTSPLALARAIRVDFQRVPGKVTYALADQTRLKQVLLNLLSNAIKYNHRHGWVRITVDTRDERVRISVRDGGRGMSETQLAELFKPFTRFVDENEQVQGTGIGLTITRHLVDMMGGELHVTSTPMMGSCFEVALPMVGAGAHDADEIMLPLTQDDQRLLDDGTEPLRVLYVEDNPANQLLMQRILANIRWVQFDVASTGAVGLEKAISHTYGLLMLDINLPDLDGYSLKACLDDEPGLQGVPMLAVSANAMADDIQRGRDAGFADYLTKPFKLDDLMAWLKRARLLQQRRVHER